MEKKKIQQIFNGSTLLEIPYFQRSYVWDEENWKRFLDDFREICINQKEYFMGTYIMKQKPTPSGSRYGDLQLSYGGSGQREAAAVYDGGRAAGHDILD